MWNGPPPLRGFQKKFFIRRVIPHWSSLSALVVAAECRHFKNMGYFTFWISFSLRPQTETKKTALVWSQSGVEIKATMLFLSALLSFRTVLRLLFCVIRLWANKSREAFLLLYKHLVRSHLEYCNSVWAPYKKILHWQTREDTKTGY